MEKENHIARIVAIHQNEIDVKILDESSDNCSGCRIAGVCNATGSRSFAISVADSGIFSVGQTIEIQPKKASSWNAIALAFGLPIAILAAIVAILSCFNLNEGVTALVAILFISAYFLLLYLLRKKVAAKVQWEITGS